MASQNAEILLRSAASASAFWLTTWTAPTRMIIMTPMRIPNARRVDLYSRSIITLAIGWIPNSNDVPPSMGSPTEIYTTQSDPSRLQNLQWSEEILQLFCLQVIFASGSAKESLAALINR